MADPKTIEGSRVCFALTSAGLTAYGNSAGLRSLARWLEWVASSQPEEHFECHSTLALESEAVLLKGLRPKNVWVLVEKEFEPILDQGKVALVDGETLKHSDFEVTFMAVTESDLDEMVQFQSTGLLPDNWGDK